VGVYRRAVDPMPELGDPYASAFVMEPMKCWRMVHELQADHCPETPSWTGRWFSPAGEVARLGGLREFGRRR
jgi:hypothetical protein